jgi:hypothetical protein
MASPEAMATAPNSAFAANLRVEVQPVTDLVRRRSQLAAFYCSCHLSVLLQLALP